VGTNVLVNRVAVDKPLTLRSVNGPQVTVIQGAKAPGGGIGDGAIRCVYLTSGASLSGFTLTNGATRDFNYSPPWPKSSGGGLRCESATAVVSNCVLAGNSAGDAGGGVWSGTLNTCTLTGNSVAGYGGGAFESTLNNCTLTGNSAFEGGGAYGGTLNNCTLTGNSAYFLGGGAFESTLNNCTLTGNLVYCADYICFGGFGGGALEGTLNNCTLIGNWAQVGGGGASGATLNNCTLSGNSAEEGGGADGCTLNNCILTGNSAYGAEMYGGGGGASGCTLNNCILTGNWAGSGSLGGWGWGGGGADGCTLNNCTLTGNSAQVGGGAGGSTLNNCIVYFNTNGGNYSGGALNYCCTTPLPTNGVGNISLDPQLASTSHLSANSPCRGAGSAAYTSGVDIDGEAWASPPSIGCDEYHAGAVTGPLSVTILADYTNVVAGYTAKLTALIEGPTTASAWDFGDGVVLSNRPYATHAWTAPRDYTLLLRAYNESYPAGVSATVTVHVVTEPVLFVAADSTTPVPPYTSWATAATNIQDAVDAASVAGSLVLVTNGVYATGGRAVVGTMTNRVAVDKPLTLRSVNGPQATVIQGAKAPGGGNGDGAIRCVYLTSGASLSGFTLTNGATHWGGNYYHEQRGGGVWCESASAMVSNCLLAGNSAYGDSGGAFAGTLNNCTLTGNSAINYGGGGAFGSTLNNCTLTGNSGGGAGCCTLNNCIVYFNTDGGNCGGCTVNYCCTTPLPGGVGNITNAPLFVDYAGGNLRLQSNSPCINAGLNAYAPGPTDLDGNPRIVSGSVDIGAYEDQGLGSIISYAWLQGYGLPTDGSADFLDPDGDGHTTCQEWRCQTDPTNALSALRLLSATPSPTNADVTVTWQSVAGVTYFLERSTNLASPLAPRASNLPGQPVTTSYTDTNAASLAPLFYRVGVP
jgi:hypothetical protein